MTEKHLKYKVISSKIGILLFDSKNSQYLGDHFAKQCQNKECHTSLSS